MGRRFEPVWAHLKDFAYQVPIFKLSEMRDFPTFLENKVDSDIKSV